MTAFSFLSSPANPRNPGKTTSIVALMGSFFTIFQQLRLFQLGDPLLRAMTVCLLLSAAAVQQVSAATPPGAATAPARGSAANGALAKHDSNAPINVTSDNFVGNFETKVGTYIGNVIVTQADYKLRADRVKVDVVNNKPTKFEAFGHVVFVSTSGTATGDNGVYDLGPPRTVTLTGRVVLTKEKDVMHGTMLTVNMVTGESHLTAQGSPGNRVQGLFVQQPSSQGSAKPAGGAPK
jgi:lipopolysaccharide export system protein LptA